MSVKPRVSYKLSPNEEAEVLRSQREERRKARLVQVREQEREAARRTREEARQKREKERKLLQDHLQSRLLASHVAELAAVQNRYSSASRHIGLGHRQAQQVEKEENHLHELRLLLAAKQRERAEDRHVAALREELSYRQQRKGERKKQVERLRLTREQEGRRAREAASRTTQQPPIIMDLVAGKGRRVRLREVEGYSSSYYHIPSCTVQRAATEEREGPDAQQMAELMSEEMQAADKQCSAVQEEQKELARLRHKHALNRVKMEKEKQELLHQLKALEREDRTLRQKALAMMPSNVYQPVERRREEAREQQRDMEQAFEKLFVKTHGVSTHQTLSQIANPTPDPITPSPPPSHSSPVTASQETTPTTYPASLLERPTLPVGTPDPVVREKVTVSIPTVKFVRSDSSYSSSMTTTSAVTPSSSMSFLTSTGSSVSVAAELEGQEPYIESKSAQMKETRVPGTDPHSGSFQPTTVQGTKTREGREKVGENPIRHSVEVTMPRVADSSSVTESVLSTPQHQQQGAGELSMSELTPSEDTVEQHLPPTTATLPPQWEGMKRLVTMVHAQQQAWSQRVAARHTLLHHTTSQLQQQQQQPTVPPKRAVVAPSVPVSPPPSSHSLSPSPEPGSAAPTREPPSLSVFTLSSSDVSAATVEGSKEPSAEETRFVTREAWSKPPHHITTVSHHLLHPPTNATHYHPPPLHTVTSTAQPIPPSHPLTHTIRPPPSSLITHRAPPAQQPSGPAHQPRVSITAHESTVYNSGASQQHDHQDSTLPYPLHLLLTSSAHYSHVPMSTSNQYTVTDTHITMPPVSASTGDSDSKPEEDRKDDREEHEIAGVLVEDREESEVGGSYAGLGSDHAAVLRSPFSSPPLVEPHSAETLRSSQYSTWSEDETSTTLSIDTPTNLKDVTGAVLTSPASPSVTIPPSLPLTTPNLAISVPSTLSPHTFTHSQPLSTSQPSKSVLTSSTVSSFSLTPVSFLSDPSPTATLGYTAFLREDTRQPPTSMFPVSCPEEVHAAHGKIMPGHNNQDIVTLRPDLFESGQSRSAPASLPRPNLSIATEDTDAMPLGHSTSQDITPCPEVSTEAAQSLDTTPTHTTLQLPADYSESDPSISPIKSTILPQNIPPHTSKSFDISSQLASPLSPSSLQTKTHTTSAPPSTSTSALSLQEAFLRRKADFVKQSQWRSEQLKTNASDRQIQSSLEADNTRQHKAKNQPKTPASKRHSLPPSSAAGSGSSTLAGSSKGGGGCGGKENRRRAVTFSSPVLCSSHSSGRFSPPLEHKVQGAPVLTLTQRKQKISAKEMRERNQRFYNWLPEVRSRKLEEKRSATYTSNRQKAKVYQEWVRARMQRKPRRIHTSRKPPFK